MMIRLNTCDLVPLNGRLARSAGAASFLSRTRACLSAGPAVLALLAACTTHPKIDATALAGRAPVTVSANVAPAGGVDGRAYTRGEGAAAGGAGGAYVGLGIWANELGAYALVLAPQVILATVLVGAGIGAAGGAASGTSYTREDIDRAVGVLVEAHKPERYGEPISRHFAAALAARYPAPEESRTSGPAQVRLWMRMQLVPARSGASKGAIDLLAGLTLSAHPRNVIQPGCISWQFRHPVGNLFDLARENGAGLHQSIQALLPTMADDIATLLTGMRASSGSDAANAVYTEADLKALSLSGRGRKMIETGEVKLGAPKPVVGQITASNAAQVQAMELSGRTKRRAQASGATRLTRNWKRLTCTSEGYQQSGL